MRKLMPDEARFWTKVRKEPKGCWIWLGTQTRDGYGFFAVGLIGDGSKKLASAHRWSYEHFIGPIPPALTIDHLCFARLCVNPAHMEVVTMAENQRRTRAETKFYTRSDTCRWGHPLLPLPNRGVGLYGPLRKCRTCKQAWQRDRYWAKKGLPNPRPINHGHPKKEEVVA